MAQIFTTFITTYSQQLRLLSFVLGAFSVVFGGKALGRFRSLTKPGGFYARVLVALPATAFFAATNYLYLSLAPKDLVRGLTQALRYSLTIPELALLAGVFLGMIPALAYDNTFRPAFGSKNPWSYAPAWIRGVFTGVQLGNISFTDSKPNQKTSEASSSETSQADATPTTSSLRGCLSSIAGLLGEVLKRAVTAYPYYLLSVLLVSQFVFVILGWFGGQRPPLATLAIVAGIIATFTLPGIYSILASQYIVQREGSCLLMLVFYGLGIVLQAPGFALMVGLAGMTVYIALMVGWLFLLYLVVSQLSEYLLMAVRGGADRLSTRSLLSLFAVPGGIAVILQFAINNTNLLPH